MFLSGVPETNEIRSYIDSARAECGFVMNLTRLWAWRVDFAQAFAKMRVGLMSGSTLEQREFALLVCVTATSLGDSYCALAWGARLASATDPETAASILRDETPASLTVREAALAEWARKVVTEPNSTNEADVERLRRAGMSDKEIFEATAFVALRLAFSTINDALGTLPDLQLTEIAPPAVRAAVDFGRPVAPRRSS